MVHPLNLLREQVLSFVELSNSQTKQGVGIIQETRKEWRKGKWKYEMRRLLFPAPRPTPNGLARSIPGQVKVQSSLYNQSL